MSQTFGELIRERRLGRGLSLGQLASEVSTTANQVRRWERGEETPSVEIQDALAIFLAIDRHELEVLASSIDIPDTTLDDDAQDTVDEREGQLKVDAPGVGMRRETVVPPELVARPEPLVPPQPELPVESEMPVVLQIEGAVGMDATRALDVQHPVEPVQSNQAETSQVYPVALDVEPGPTNLLDPDDPLPVPLKYPESAPAGVAVEITETEPNLWNPLRYLYDPAKPWLYWIRAGATVVVLLILLNILFGSVGELFDKIGEVLDTIEPANPAEDPTTVDDS